MSITIRQIAEESGLSIQTVSQILKGNAAYREETRERVLALAEQKGYRPNSSARAMRSGRFHNLGLLLSTVRFQSILSPSLLEGILDEAAAQNFNVTVSRLADETLVSADALPRVLTELGVDGLLIKYDSGYPEEMLALLKRLRLPAIWINSRQAADCIYPDDYGGARLAVEHYITQGHTRIAYVDWLNAYHYSTTDRKQGYQDAMTAAGLEPRLITEFLHTSDPVSIRETSRWLAEANRPTACLAYHGGLALKVAVAAMAHGLTVGDDIAIAGFSDNPWNEFALALDTVLIPEDEIGREAVQMLLQRIAHPDIPQEPRSYPLRFVTGHPLDEEEN